MLFTKHVFFDHVPCSDFPPFPRISHDFPAFPRYPPPAHQVPPRIAGVLDIGFMDVSPCRATVLACMSHQAAMRSPGGSQDANQAFPHRPRQTGVTRSRRPAVPPASGFGVTRHETRDTGFFRHASRLFPKHGLYGRSIRRGCARDAQPETAARTTAPAARSLLACALWSGCCAAGAAVVVRVERLGAAWSGILPHNQCPRSVRRSRLATRRTPKEPMLRKRSVLYSADTRAVSVAGILPSEYNGRTAAMRGMCIWPAFLTTRRGEVRERAVRTRRKPLGARRRT